MADTTLKSFIKESLQAGQTREAIQAALEKAGWRKKEVIAALDLYDQSDFPVAVPKPKPYLSAREAFLYLFFFILLGIAAFNLGSLLFALIDHAIPEGLSDYRYEYLARQMRNSIAGLIISLPIFIYVARTLQKGRRTNPMMQRSRIRKWLTYLSLIVAGCTLIGDSITLLAQFLNGDLTLRFSLKALVIAIIAGGIFGYFIGDAEHGDEHDQAA